MPSLLLTAALTAMVIPRQHVGIRVCKNTACKKDGAQDTLESLFYLASTSEQANGNVEFTGAACSAMQASFAASRVQASGCLGQCGTGPNCATTDSDDLFFDVYKPASCVALLKHVGVDVPDAAQRAWLRRMYAMRALRRNDPREAKTLLTQALTEASELRSSAAHMLQALLELRADVQESLGDREGATSDRQRAAHMRELTQKSAVVQR